jgi:hypothetical protein
VRSGEERSEEDAHNALVQAQEMRQRPSSMQLDPLHTDYRNLWMPLTISTFSPCAVHNHLARRSCVSLFTKFEQFQVRIDKK